MQEFLLHRQGPVRAAFVGLASIVLEVLEFLRVQILRSVPGLGCILGCHSGLVMDFQLYYKIPLLRSLRPEHGLSLGLTIQRPPIDPYTS